MSAREEIGGIKVFKRGQIKKILYGSTVRLNYATL